MRHRIGKLAAALATTGLLGAGAYAFTAANYVPASYAGAGTASINGYMVSGITYGLSPHGNFIQTVSFNLNNYAKTVDVGIDPGPGPGGPPPPPPPPPVVWLSCAGNGYHFVCTAPTGPGGHGVPIFGADSLEVNAAQ